MGEGWQLPRILASSLASLSHPIALATPGSWFPPDPLHSIRLSHSCTPFSRWAWLQHMITSFGYTSIFMKMALVQKLRYFGFINFEANFFLINSQNFFLKRPSNKILEILTQNRPIWWVFFFLKIYILKHNYYFIYKISLHIFCLKNCTGKRKNHRQSNQATKQARNQARNQATTDLWVIRVGLFVYPVGIFSTNVGSMAILLPPSVVRPAVISSVIASEILRKRCSGKAQRCWNS